MSLCMSGSYSFSIAESSEIFLWAKTLAKRIAQNLRASYLCGDPREAAKITVLHGRLRYLCTIYNNSTFILSFIILPFFIS